MLETRSLEYDLPPDRIARRPVEPRDAARLLVLSRTDPNHLEHRIFRDLPDLLDGGDRLVRNATRVLQARITGKRSDTGGRVEGLYVRGRGQSLTLALKSNGRLRAGEEIDLDTPSGGRSGWSIVLDRREDEYWMARLRRPGQDTPRLSIGEVLDEIGRPPLPPYILGARRSRDEPIDDAHDRDWYQTVFAHKADAGSVAAPTAGLHFTPELLQRLARAGVESSELILHVGPGTFRPIETPWVEQHPMHHEQIEITGRTVVEIEQTRKERGRIVCVGTTSVRALESLPSPISDRERAQGRRGETDLLIAPGYQFTLTDALVTNFHLPRSTLLALVAALLPEGIERLLEVYRIAIREGYRFYSYGDAMLIL